MVKQLQLKSLLLLCALMVGGCLVSASAADETFTFSNMELTNAQQYTTFTGTDCSITFGDGANDGKYYNTGAAIRVYGGGHMTVASTTKTIEKIELTFGTGDSSNTISTDVGTYKNNAWTGSAKSVTFSVGGSSGHRRIASVAVTYTPTAVSVTGVSLNKSELTLAVGEDETLTATVSPDNATDKSVTWSSSNSTIAEVDTDGKVTANAVGGPVTITATTTDGSFTATCTVNVIAARVDVTGVTLNKTATTITYGESETLTATVAPADATDKTVNWTTSDDAVATVADGVVTAVGVGTADITVTTEDGGFTATCTVTVEPIHVSGVTLNKATTTITCGESETLTATVAPAEASDQSLTWTSSNTDVATVADGVVTAVAVGTAVITVTTNDQGKTATCEVTVTANSAKPSLEVTLFNESFTGCTGSESGSTNPGESNLDTDIVCNEKVYMANGYVRLGSGSYAGTVTTPAIAFTGNATLSFRAKGKAAGNALEITISNGKLNKNSVSTTAEFDTYTVAISGVTSNPTITLTANAGKQVFIDDIKVTQTKTAVDVKLAASGYASYCSLFALDLTPTDDYAAYAVTGTDEATVTFAKIPGKVAANTPFILYNSEKGGETVSLPVIEDDDAEIAAVAGNILVGTLSPTYVSQVNGSYTNFGLSGGAFVKINDGTVPANKAYLPILTSNVPAAARLSIVFADEATSINTVNHENTTNSGYYTLQGQRVDAPQKGLYIVNGKKIIIK